jgi:hypothetical protein
MNANYKTTKLSLLGIAFGMFFITVEKAEALNGNNAVKQYATQISLQKEPLVVNITAKKASPNKKKGKKKK